MDGIGLQVESKLWAETWKLIGFTLHAFVPLWLHVLEIFCYQVLENRILKYLGFNCERTGLVRVSPDPGSSFKDPLPLDYDRLSIGIQGR